MKSTHFLFLLCFLHSQYSLSLRASEDLTSKQYQHNTASVFTFGIQQLEKYKEVLNTLGQKLEQKEMFKTLHLLFIIDITGSMGDWLQAAKDSIVDIINSIYENAKILEIKTAFVGYRDSGDNPQFQFQDFKTDPKYLLNKILKLYAQGGGDSAENVIGALRKAKYLSHGKGVFQAFLICDAPSHGKQYYPGFDVDDKQANFIQSGALQNALKDLKDLDYKSSHFQCLTIGGAAKKMCEVISPTWGSNFKSYELSNTAELKKQVIKTTVQSISQFQDSSDYEPKLLKPKSTQSVTYKIPKFPPLYSDLATMSQQSLRDYWESQFIRSLKLSVGKGIIEIEKEPLTSASQSQRFRIYDERRNQTMIGSIPNSENESASFQQAYRQFYVTSRIYQLARYHLLKLCSVETSPIFELIPVVYQLDSPFMGNTYIYAESELTLTDRILKTPLAESKYKLAHYFANFSDYSYFLSGGSIDLSNLKQLFINATSDLNSQQSKQEGSGWETWICENGREYQNSTDSQDDNTDNLDRDDDEIQDQDYLCSIIWYISSVIYTDNSPVDVVVQCQLARQFTLYFIESKVVIWVSMIFILLIMKITCSNAFLFTTGLPIIELIVLDGGVLFYSQKYSSYAHFGLLMTISLCVTINFAILEALRLFIKVVCMTNLNVFRQAQIILMVTTVFLLLLIILLAEYIIRLSGIALDYVDFFRSSYCLQILIYFVIRLQSQFLVQQLIALKRQFNLIICQVILMILLLGGFTYIEKELSSQLSYILIWQTCITGFQLLILNAFLYCQKQRAPQIIHFSHVFKLIINKICSAILSWVLIQLAFSFTVFMSVLAFSKHSQTISLISIFVSNLAFFSSSIIRIPLKKYIPNCSNLSATLAILGICGIILSILAILWDFVTIPILQPLREPIISILFVNIIACGIGALFQNCYFGGKKQACLIMIKIAWAYYFRCNLKINDYPFIPWVFLDLFSPIFIVVALLIAFCKCCCCTEVDEKEDQGSNDPKESMTSKQDPEETETDTQTKTT